MADEQNTPERFSLSRWSRRKLEAARPAPVAAAEVPLTAAVPAAAAPVPVALPEPAPLPPVESLSLESDFSVFMQPKVDEDVKRAALKKLFSDPRFNVMDGLDIYTGDYTQADPMPAGMLDKLANVYGMLKDEPAAAAKAAADAGADAGAGAGVATPAPATASEPPVVDAAAPVVDAAAPVVDAAAPVVDAAAPVVDAAPSMPVAESPLAVVADAVPGGGKQA
ncbi:MAG: DUF3306 domain-containing protein [Betaproteobacteria bacterium]